MSEVIRYWSVASFCAVVATLRTETLISVLRLLFVAILLSYIPYAMFGAFSSFDEYGVRRFASFFPHANHLAYVCAITISSYVVAGSEFFGSKRLWLFNLFIVATVLWLTKSSGGLLAAMVSGGVSYLFTRASKRVIRNVLLMILVIFGVYISGALSETIQKILATNLDSIQRHAEALKFGGQNSSFAWRLTYWQAILNAQVSQGMTHILLGFGAGSSGFENSIFSFMNRDPHNDYLKLYFEYGLIGAPIVILSLLLSMAVQRGFFVAVTLFAMCTFAANSLNSLSVLLTYAIFSCILRSYYSVGK